MTYPAALERGAGARLRRGRSELRRRRARHGAQARHPDQRRLRLRRSTATPIFVEGISAHRAGGSRRRRRARLPHQAARRRAAHRERHRAARAPDHGAARLRHRPHLRRHQRGGGRGRFHRRRHAVRARAPAATPPPRRWSATSSTWRAACACRRSAARPRAWSPTGRRRMQAHEGGYYLRLKVRDRPGAFAAIARRMAEAGISLDSIVQRNRPPGTAPRHGIGRSAAGHDHHAFDHRAGGARRACATSRPRARFSGGRR